MNPISRLLGNTLSPSADEEVPFSDLTPEEQDAILAEEKAARVQYHRDHVRNGPQSYRTITVGQQRRAAERGKASLNRKVNRRHRRRFFQTQRDFALLRAQLQAVGALPYATEYAAPVTARLAAGQWLLAAFGERDDDGALVLEDGALETAVRRGVETYADRNKSARKGA